MKKIVLTMVALVSMTAAMAQSDKQQNADQQGPRRPNPEMMMEFMAKELKLTDDQKAKMIDLNKEYEERMQKILSEDQYKQYQQMRMRPGRPFGQRGGHRGGPRPNGQRPEHNTNE